ILTWRSKSKIDESLDAWAVHGWGGIWGAIATGIFASVGVTGLIKGNLGQVWIQIIGVIATILYSFLVTWVIAKVINKLMNLRTSEEVEYLGIDIAIHGEKA
ncbi:MAG: ammonium transporter, partial [Promethearchaeota archaeon]